MAVQRHRIVLWSGKGREIMGNRRGEWDGGVALVRDGIPQGGRSSSC